MSMTINGRTIASEEVQGIYVRPLLGAYEFVISVRLNLRSEDCGASNIDLFGMRVIAKSDKSNQSQEIGFATTDGPCRIKLFDFVNDQTFSFGLILQPNQIGALETLRDGGELSFELQLKGEAEYEDNIQRIHDTWKKRVPRSDWIQTLKSANARNVLLIEVSVPLTAASKKWTAIAKAMEKAENHFRLGHYHECVSACRNIVQDLGYKNFNDENWSTNILKQLATNRTSMTKNDREASIWATLKNYTHQAHHPESEGGEEIYSPAEAKLILTLSAALVARVQAA